jgi:pseudaminic acid cytidylyltransferase
MNCICIIPARGGSKRIPQKNIRPFLGKPVINYSIEAAHLSHLFDMVMVSTDNDQIAETALGAGALVPFMRSIINANDEAGTAAVLIEVLQQYAEQGIIPKYACCLYAAAPFVTPALLKQAYQLFIKEDYDTVFPVIPFDYPVQRGLLLNDGIVNMRNPEYKNSRSQDLEQVYHDAGMFYFFKPESLLQTKHLWAGRTGGIPLSSLQAQDIDTPTDWEAAEWKYSFARKKGLI